jgi:ABC-type transport system involved in multi-copper enzyme maturation permease subunit
VTASIRSELLKIRTTRGWYGYLAVVVLLAGLAVAGDIGSSPDERSLVEFQVRLADAGGLAALLAIILGITVVTTEFRHGTITPTLLGAPLRERVVGAKAVATILVSLLFTLLALVVVLAVAIPWLSIVDAELHFTDRDVLVRGAQVFLLAVLWGLLGVAIGTLVQSQVAALVGTLVWIFLGETLLIGLFSLLDFSGVDFEGAADYLPFQALDAADGTTDELLSYWKGVAVSLVWIAAVGAAGTERIRRRDIT